MKSNAPRSAHTFGLGLLLLCLVTGVLVPGVCASQTMNANSASYNAGYGRTAGSENQPVNVSMTDTNGNMVVVGGLIQNGTAGSVFASSGANAAAFANAGGVGSSTSGVSTGSASAIGNNLSVVVQGDHNVVVVNSTQTNTGAVTATTTTNGN